MPPVLAKEISPKELKAILDSGERILILDVREPNEFALANIGGHLIPLGELEKRFTEVDPTQTIVTLCHHGVRSRHAAQFLRAQGYSKVSNLSGGIERWSQEIDSGVARY